MFVALADLLLLGREFEKGGLSPQPRLDPNLPPVEYTGFWNWIKANGVSVPKVRLS